MTKVARPVPALSPTHIFLAAQLLDIAGNEFANHGCNDFELPDFMSADNRRALDVEYHAWNGDPEEGGDDSRYSNDSALMSFLAAVLRKAAGDVDKMSPEREDDAVRERRSEILRGAKLRADSLRREAQRAAEEAEKAEAHVRGLARDLGL